MKTKVFTILMALMLLPGMALALNYTQATTDISNYDAAQWNDVATCNAQLKVDGTIVANATTAAQYTILAYMNGSLRGYQATASTRYPDTGGPATYFYMTHIRANAASETGDPITFYVLNKTTKKVYQASHTHAWTEGTLEMPSSGGMIEISTSVPVSDITVVNASVMAKSTDVSKFPGSNYAPNYNWCVDLSNYYTVLPTDATNPAVTVTCLDTSTGADNSSGTWHLFVNAGGTYSVNITSTDGTDITKKLTLVVKIPVTDIIPYNPEKVWRNDIITSGYDVKGKYTIMPDEATDRSVTLTLNTTKTTCAGTFTGTVFKPAANGKGDVYINIASVSNPEVTAEYKFTVAVKVEDLVLAATSKSMNVGETLDMGSWYSLSPADATGTVTVTSSDTSVATVSNTSGAWKITGVASGTTTLTFTVPTGEMDVTGAPISISKDLTVTVSQPVTGIVISPKLGDDDFIVWRKEAQTSPYIIQENIHYIVEPYGATNTAVTMDFVSGYESMGTLTLNDSPTHAPWYEFKPAADKKGEVKIKITSVENTSISTILTLTVKVAVESITVNPSTVTVGVGSKTDLTPMVTVLPEDADDKSVIFSVDKASLGSIDASNNFTALAAGTAKVTVESSQNSTVKAYITFTIKDKCSGVNITVSDNTDFDLASGAQRLALGESRTVYYSLTPAGCYFDDTKLSATYTLSGTLPTGWTGAEITKDGTACYFTPKVPGTYTLTITYTNPDGTTVSKSTTLNAYPAVSLDNGWTWVSSNAATNVSTVVSEFGSNLIEARTQNIYLVNDPSWGYISDNGKNDIDLKSSVDNGHFRIKTDKAVKTLIDGTYNYKGDSWAITTGWNWVNNPIYYSVALTQLDDLAGFTEGDVLKSKDGAFATYASGKWTGSLTSLAEGKAYSLQSKATSAKIIDFSGISFAQAFTSAGPLAAPKRVQPNGWSYDATLFMSNMGLIAEIPQISDPENFIIGTFVGGECRGEGKCIDGRWYIFAHGQAGDKVTFKVINNLTGQIADLNEVVDFAELVGSYDSPYILTTSNTEISGITDAVASADMNVSGSTILGEGIEIYDINGRRMTAANGSLQPGIYIVKSNGHTYKVSIK